MRSKEQSTKQSTEQSTEQSTVSAVKSTVQSTEQSTVQSNDTFVYGVGMLTVLEIGVYIFFGYNNFRPKKPVNEKQNQPPKRRHML